MENVWKTFVQLDCLLACLLAYYTGLCGGWIDRYRNVSRGSMGGDLFLAGSSRLGLVFRILEGLEALKATIVRRVGIHFHEFNHGLRIHFLHGFGDELRSTGAATTCVRAGGRSPQRWRNLTTLHGTTAAGFGRGRGHGRRGTVIALHRHTAAG